MTGIVQLRDEAHAVVVVEIVERVAGHAARDEALVVALEESAFVRSAILEEQALGRGSSSTSIATHVPHRQLPVDDRHRRAVRVSKKKLSSRKSVWAMVSRTVLDRPSRTTSAMRVPVGLGDGEAPGRDPRGEALDEPRPHRCVLLLGGLVRVVVHRTQPGQARRASGSPTSTSGERRRRRSRARHRLGRATGDLVGQPRRRRGPRAAARTCSPCCRCRCSTRQASAGRA